MKITDCTINLSPQAKKLVDSGKISSSNAMELAKVPASLQSGLLKEARTLHKEQFARVVLDWFKARQEVVEKLVSTDCEDPWLPGASFHELFAAEEILKEQINENPSRLDLRSRLGRIHAAHKHRAELIEEIDFLFNEAVAWVGNKAPEDMDDYENACKKARDGLTIYVRGGK